MKKIGIFIFAAAIILGVIVSSFFSFGRVGRSLFNISFNKTTKGSGHLATERRDLDAFTGIDVSGGFQIEITAQKDFAVEVEADDNLLPLIKTEVRGGVLHIETEQRVSSENGLKIRISAPDIDDIDASGASRVNLAAVKNDNLRVHTSGASRITLSGETDEFIVEASGACTVEAGNLKARKADVDISGASTVIVFATDDLRSEASGASKIFYSGNPKNIEKSSSGASTIREK